jgi:hypothetical protein
MRCAQVGQPLSPPRGCRHRRDLGSGRGRKLGQEVADTAGGAGEQYAAPAHGARLAQQAQRGETGQRQRRGGDGANVVGKDSERGRGHRDALGPSAGAGVADHSLTHGWAGTIGGSLDDATGDVLAG